MKRIRYTFRLILQTAPVAAIALSLALPLKSANAGVSQDWILAKGVLIRLLMLPIDPFVIAVKELIEKRYDGYSKNFPGEQAAALLDSACGNVWDDQSGKPREERCSCEEVCPDSFRILEPSLKRMEPKNENLLHFLNDEENFDDLHSRTLGYCWGQTTVLRNFNYLAIFDAENKAGADVPNRSKHPKKWLRFYRRLIRQVLRGNVAVIPGFKTLWDFTSDPTINLEMRKQTVKTWRKNAVRLEALPILLRSTNPSEMKPSEVNEVVSEIKKGLSMNQSPKIWFTHQDDWQSVHVVPVYEIREREEGTQLCFVDNHGYEDQHEDCGQNVLIRFDGSLYYAGWDFYGDGKRTIRAMGITPEDRLENVRFTESLSKACRAQTKCRN